MDSGNDVLYKINRFAPRAFFRAFFSRLFFMPFFMLVFRAFFSAVFPAPFFPPRVLFAKSSLNYLLPLTDVHFGHLRLARQ